MADAAVRAGHTVRLLDLMFAKDPLSAVRAELRRRPARAVGVSVRNLDNNDMRDPQAFAGEAQDIVRAVRAESQAPVALGGAGVGVMPEAMLARTGADVAAVGDGATIFPQWLNALEHQASLDTVPGLAWRRNGGTVRSAPRSAATGSPCRTIAAG